MPSGLSSPCWAPSCWDPSQQQPGALQGHTNKKLLFGWPCRAPSTCFGGPARPHTRNTCLEGPTGPLPHLVSQSGPLKDLSRGPMQHTHKKTFFGWPTRATQDTCARRALHSLINKNTKTYFGGPARPQVVVASALATTWRGRFPPKQAISLPFHVSK